MRQHGRARQARTLEQVLRGFQARGFSGRADARQRIADTVSAVTESSAPSERKSTEKSIRDCQRRVRMKPPLPTAATMRARTMIDAIAGTELLAAAPGSPSTMRGDVVSGR